MSPRTYRTRTPLEALLVEQALLLAGQLQTVADAAPDGHVLRAVEAFAVPAGRELTRKAVEATLQAQAEGVEKGCARGAGRPTTRSTGGSGSTGSSARWPSGCCAWPVPVGRSTGRARTSRSS